MPNARVLTAQAGTTLRERLGKLLPLHACAAAAIAGEAAAVVVDSPGHAAADAVVALRDAGGFAEIVADRLVVSGGRNVFTGAHARLEGPARALVDELLRAFDADRRRPRSVRFRDLTLDVSAGPKIVGILNVTPDSFFDRGAYRGIDRARARASEMVAHGADVIDIGGQSYASGNPIVAEAQERERVLPVVEALVRDGLGVPLSIDTYNSGVADAALAAGAHLINDCSGLADPKLAATAARYDAGLVVMHLKGELNVRSSGGYRYEDALGEILDFLRERTDRALENGVGRDALVVDPGLEFGKEPATDLEILANFGDLRSLGYPVLFAASRKSFIGAVFDRPASELLVPSLAAAALGAVAGAGLIRVHDVRETAQLAAMLAAVRGVPAN